MRGGRRSLLIIEERCIIEEMCGSPSILAGSDCMTFGPGRAPRTDSPCA